MFMNNIYIELCEKYCMMLRMYKMGIINFFLSSSSGNDNVKHEKNV